MKKNVVTKKYMSDNEKFADAFNYTLYGGEQVIRPEDLVERDGNEFMADENEHQEFMAQDRDRDILKMCVIRHDENADYILLGIENQSDVHYAMPVRNMLYDALNYARQVEKTATKHRKMKDLTGAEYISGLSKEDRIVPIITQVVYFGAEKWDGPRTLHEMFDIKDERLKQYVADYKLNLIIPDEIEDTAKFQSDLRYVMEFIKNSKDKEKMQEVVERHREYFENIPKDTALLLKQCTQINLEVPKEREEMNMCKAFDDMIEDAKEEGRQEMCKAFADMIEDAKEEGRQEIREAMDDMMEGAKEEGRQEMREAMDDMMEGAKEEGRQEMREAMDGMVEKAREETQKEFIMKMLTVLSPDEIIALGCDRKLVLGAEYAKN